MTISSSDHTQIEKRPAIAKIIAIFITKPRGGQGSVKRDTFCVIGDLDRKFYLGADVSDSMD